MSISAVTASTAVSILAPSDPAPVRSSPAGAVTAAPLRSPSVINSIGGISSISGQIASSPSIQSSVDGINALIANYNRIVWSRTGLTPQQIANGKLQEQKLALAAEGATIAFAGQEGVTGVSFDFGTVNLGVSSPGGASENNAAPAAGPSVSNGVDGISSVSGQILSSPSIQSAVSGLNAEIENVNNSDWSKLDLTPQQITAAELQEQKLFQAAEGATIAFAGQEGVTGVSFNFGTVNLGFSSSADASDKTIGLGNAQPIAASSSTLTANSAADIALSLLTQTTKPLNVIA